MTKPLYTAPNPLNLTLKTLTPTTLEVLLFTKAHDYDRRMTVE